VETGFFECPGQLWSGRVGKVQAQGTPPLTSLNQILPCSAVSLECVTQPAISSAKPLKYVSLANLRGFVEIVLDKYVDY
jgi:hypothetical protein